ncbi:hypothetical protein ACNVED_08540 [Legionella sp. D16C41]|uniref:hypothetical protein n=1 Tax=Legionella sp. D16C41 TaxID=3402688 RepID=UPI003AF6F961
MASEKNQNHASTSDKSKDQDDNSGVTSDEQKTKQDEDKKLNKTLKGTFPASDPPGNY